MKIKHPKTLGPLEAILNKIGGDDGVDLLLSDKLVLVDPNKGRRGFKVPSSNPLFTFAGRFHAPGAKEFVSAKAYVVDTSERARVRISYLGNNFKKHLLPTIERYIAPSDLTLSKLTRGQKDLPLSDDEPGTIAGLGGTTKTVTSASEILRTHAHNETFRNFTWTAGYVLVKDNDGNSVLWALGALWSGGGWFVEALSPSNPFRWDAGRGFVSR